jgi:hypothetical protein
MSITLCSCARSRSLRQDESGAIRSRSHVFRSPSPSYEHRKSLSAPSMVEFENINFLKPRSLMIAATVSLWIAVHGHQQI